MEGKIDINISSVLVGPDLTVLASEAVDFAVAFLVVFAMAAVVRRFGLGRYWRAAPWVITLIAAAGFFASRTIALRQYTSIEGPLREHLSNLISSVTSGAHLAVGATLIGMLLLVRQTPRVAEVF